MKKVLVVYYSYTNGNTEKIAERLQKEFNADIRKIETVDPYSGTYDEVVDQALQETKNHYEPPIRELDININDYDVILLGTPTWWYTMASPMLTFIHHHDFTNKTVIPFMTNAGWPGTVIKDMTRECKNAHVICSKEILFDRSGGIKQVTSEDEINAWIKEIKKYTEGCE